MLVRWATSLTIPHSAKVRKFQLQIFLNAFYLFVITTVTPHCQFLVILEHQLPYLMVSVSYTVYTIVINCYVIFTLHLQGLVLQQTMSTVVTMVIVLVTRPPVSVIQTVSSAKTVAVISVMCVLKV